MLKNSYHPNRENSRQRRNKQNSNPRAVLHPHRQTQTQGNRRPMKRSRTVLALLELFGLGSIGADRFYMGSYKLGALKIALLILGILAGVFLLGPLALGFFVAYFIFVTWDSFIKGLTPIEFWLHAKPSRINLIDTSCKTSVTGDQQRRLVKTLERIVVNDAGSGSRIVQNMTNGQVVSFQYGEDGLDGTYMRTFDEL